MHPNLTPRPGRIQWFWLLLVLNYKERGLDGLLFLPPSFLLFKYTDFQEVKNKELQKSHCTCSLENNMIKI